MHTYTHTYIHTFIHTYLHTYIPTYPHTYLHTYVPTYPHTYLHTYIPTYLHTYIYTYTLCEVCGQRSSRSDEVYYAKVQRSGRGPSEEDAERCDKVGRVGERAHPCRGRKTVSHRRFKLENQPPGGGRRGGAVAQPQLRWLPVAAREEFCKPKPQTVSTTPGSGELCGGRTIRLAVAPLSMSGTYRR